MTSQQTPTPAFPGPADVLELVFREPIKLGEAEFRSVTLTEPTGEQLAQAEAVPGGMGSLLALIAKNGGIAPSIVAKMRQRDLQRAADFFAAFGKSDGPESTASSSQS